jgi:hypothetical protein
VGRGVIDRSASDRWLPPEPDERIAGLRLHDRRIQLRGRAVFRLAQMVPLNFESIRRGACDRQLAGVVRGVACRALCRLRDYAV